MDNVQAWIMFKVLITFETLHRLSPTHLLTRTLRSSSKSPLIIPTVNSVTYGQRAFSLVYAPSLWNTPVNSLKSASSVSPFEVAQKTFLI